MNNEINKRTHIEHKYLIHRFGGGEHSKCINIRIISPEETDSLPRLLIPLVRLNSFMASLFRIFW